MTWSGVDRWRAPAGDFPPRWAAAWGDDGFGLWAELTVSSATQRLRWIQPTGPGGFWMGPPLAPIENSEWPSLLHWFYADPKPVRRAVEGFWLADTPCTQGLWMAVMHRNPSHFRTGHDAPRRPVEQVDWDDVRRFLVELEYLCPLLMDHAMLPTEAQWEYAARAGSRTTYPWGDRPLDARANWASQHKGTTKVRQFAPNEWGLFDMHGNVFEWCADSSPGSVLLPTGLKRDLRVIRGGSWASHPSEARSASCMVAQRGDRIPNLGFRLAVRSSGPTQARLPAWPERTRPNMQ